MSLEQEIDNDVDIKILGVPPLGAGHAFPRQRHMRRKGDYLFLSGFSSLYDDIHEWMTGQMDGWMDGKSFTKNDHDVLYYM
jgi:hypothetical protein